ncbi:hypothetical protein CEXT_375901, partial [Caerostris extrusa]
KKKRARKWRGNEREDGSDRVEAQKGKRANSVGNSVAELNKPRVRNPETAECSRVQTVDDKLAAAFPLCLSALSQRETVFGGGAREKHNRRKVKKRKRVRRVEGNEREDGSDTVKPRRGKRANSVGNSVAKLNKPRVRNPETAECSRVQTVSDKLAAAFRLWFVGSTTTRNCLWRWRISVLEQSKYSGEKRQESKQRGNSVAELNKPRARNPETAECFRVQTVSDKLATAFPLCLSALLQQETVFGGGAFGFYLNKMIRDKMGLFCYRISVPEQSKYCEEKEVRRKKGFGKWRGNEREDGSDRVKPRRGKRANSGNSVAELNKPRVRNPETAECFRVQTVSDKLAAAFPLCLSALLQQETVFCG